MLFFVAERRENLHIGRWPLAHLCNRDFPAKNFEVEIHLARNFERRFVRKSTRRSKRR